MPERAKVEPFVHATGAFNQGPLIDDNKDLFKDVADVRGAVGLVLSIDWLSAVLDGRSYLASVGALGADSAKSALTSAQQVAKEQDICRKLADPKADPKWFTTVTEQVSKSKYTLKANRPFTIEKDAGVVDALEKAADAWKPNDAILVGLVGNGGGHALAARKLMKGWVVFDPSFGIFVPEAKLGAAMKELELFYGAKGGRMFSIAKKPIVAARPVATKPVATNPVNANPVNANPVNANPVNANPVNRNPVNANPVNRNPINANPVNANPVNANPVNANPVNANPVNANPVNANPVNANPVNANPVNANPIATKK